MTPGTPEKLVHKANLIARFFVAQPRADAVAGTLDHIKKFWDPRMRAALIGHAKSGGGGLRDLVAAAIPKLDLPPR